MEFDKNQINKLIIIYILDKMDIPLQENIITDMVTTNNWMNYLDCKESLHELVLNNMLINMSPKGSVAKYTITSDCREGFTYFYTNIPVTLREEISAHIKANRIKYRKSQDYVSDYFKNADGTYTVVLRIENGPTNLMELKINVQKRAKAKWIFENWADKAPIIYEHILENLYL